MTLIDDLTSLILRGRDGRDIAFSGNQSPVEKFFNVSFQNFLEKYNLPVSAKAIKLWSNWNTGVYHWAQEMLTERSQK